MVGYVIPLRPRARTPDWDRAIVLLRQTLNSILAAREGALKIFVVSHDLLDLEEYAQSPIRFEQVEFLLPPVGDYDAGQRDRNWKVTRGCQLAVEEKMDWVFVCDADDLVSCELNGIIEKSTGYDAVMTQNGYEVDARDARAFRRKNIQEICGSTFALRTHHVFFNSDPDFMNGLFLCENHKTLENYLLSKELRIREPKRPLIAYLRRHGGNVSDATEEVTLASKIREWLKFGLLGVPFTGQLAENFGYSRERL